MANVLLPLLPGNLASGYCYPANPQQLLNDFMNVSKALLAGGMAFYNYGSTAPAPEFQSFPWLFTGDMRWYEFIGQWISPVNLDADERRLWVGTDIALRSYDGGDGTAGPVTATSGPMWEIDTAFMDRIPFGAGGMLAVATDAGAASASLVADNIPLHSFMTARNINQAGGTPALDGTDSLAFSGGGMGQENYILLSASGVGKTANVGPTNEYGKAVPDALDTRGPVRGTYVVRPSGRLYRTAP